MPHHSPACIADFFGSNVYHGALLRYPIVPCSTRLARYSGNQRPRTPCSSNYSMTAPAIPITHPSFCLLSSTLVSRCVTQVQGPTQRCSPSPSESRMYLPTIPWTWGHITAGERGREGTICRRGDKGECHTVTSTAVTYSPALVYRTSTDLRTRSLCRDDSGVDWFRVYAF